MKMTTTITPSFRPGNIYSNTSTSCVQWSSVNGTWKYFTLNVSRSYHVSWTPDPSIGTYLMGGIDSESMKTTTLIKSDGSQEPGFSLKYNTA